MAEGLNSLPDGWNQKSVSECLQKIKTTVKIPRKKFLQEGPYPIISQEEGLINGYWDVEDDLLRVEQPIIVFGDHTQAVKYVDFNFVLGADGVKILKPKSFISTKYLYYYLLGNPIKSLGYARHYRHLKVLNVCYPSKLPEQERIVGVLDEAFEGIANATAQAEKNLQNARELFQSVLQSTFSQKGDDWVETTLNEVCDLQNGFAFKSAKFRDSGLPILRISNIQNDTIDDRKLVYANPADYKEDLSRYEIQQGDLLIAMSGATTGKLGFNESSTTYLLNQRVGKFEPSKSLDIRFLYYYLSTKVEENLSISAGAAQPNLSTKQIKDFIIPLPSIEAQKTIVEKFDTLREETKRLEAIYQRKLDALAELKQSLLQRAFTGQL